MSAPKPTPRVLRGLEFVADLLDFPDEWIDLDAKPIVLDAETQKDLRNTVAWIRELTDHLCEDG